jgi:hypothetical protein
MRLLPALIASALCASAQQADLLPRIREKMTAVLQRQPNYTCTETVERTRQAAGNHTRVEDTLRLEVALVNGKEMFAWPGSKQFEDRELDDLVATGMFGNGNFAIYARILFLSNVAVFENRGETQLGGRSAWHYEFRVSRDVSGHRLRVNDREAVVGFHGSFYADPGTLDVRRIEVVAEDIPSELGVSAAETSVDYDRREIGDEEFLLPVDSELMMAMPDVVSRNWVRFSSCRRFAGESTLSFNDPVLADAASAPAAPKKEVEIPAGLTLQLDMPALDLMQAAVGDPVQSTLRASLRSRHQLLAPKGSVARGRIVRLDRYPNYFALQIEFQDLDWPGGHAGLKLSFDHTAFATRLITRAEPPGEIVISRQAGPRLSGILMFWSTE